MTVHVRGNEKDAIVRKVPPFTELGEQRTDSVMVEYPGSTPDRALIGNLRERVALDRIEVDQ